MAVQSIPGLSRAVMVFRVGVNEEGEPVTRSQSLGNIGPEVPDEAVYAVVSALASLQQHPLLLIRRVDQKHLQEAEE